MGVIHKLKKEVVDFIVSAKKENPTLSCRSLAELAGKKFDIKISKSSVNTILKRALLSNQVGRRSKKANVPKEAKFAIPEHKKNQLFKNLSISLSAEVSSARTKKRPDLKTEIDKLLLAEQRFKFELVQEPAQSGKTDIPVVPERGPKIPPGKMRLKDSKQNPFWRERRHQDFLQYVRTLKQEHEQRMSQDLPCMGMIFFRAAEWELNRGAFWHDLFQDTSRLWPQDLPDALSLLTMHKVINRGAFLDQPQEEMPFVASQPELCQNVLSYKDIELKQTLGTLQQQQLTEHILFEYKMRRREMYLGTAFVELCLADGTKYFLDVRQFTVYTIPPLYDTSTLLKSIEDVSRYIISNQDVFYVSSLDADQDYVKRLHSFLRVFASRATQGIKQINICTRNHQPLAVFDVFPRMARRIVIGMQPDQKSQILSGATVALGADSASEYVNKYRDGLSKINESDFKAIYHNACDEVFYYKEGLIPISENGIEKENMILKGISIWNAQREQEICTLITNDFSQQTEDVLFSYLSSWRNSVPITQDRHQEQTEGQDNIFEPVGDSATVNPGLLPLLDRYAQDLINYTLKRFFPDLYLKRISDKDWGETFNALMFLRGKYYQTENDIIVSICCADTYKYKRLLQKACQALNAARIQTPENRLLVVNF